MKNHIRTDSCKHVFYRLIYAVKVNGLLFMSSFTGPRPAMHFCDHEGGAK